MSTVTGEFVAAMHGKGIEVIRLEDPAATVLSTHRKKVFKKRDPEKLKGIVFHHTAMDGNDLATVARVSEYHVGPNHVSATGAPGILYTLCILGDGRVTLNHDLRLAPWSQGYKNRPGDENAEFLSVLVLGNFDSPTNRTGNHPTMKQIETALSVMRTCFDYFDWDESAVYGHFDFGKPACPGTTLETLIRGIRSNAPKVETPTGADLDTVRGRQQGLTDLGYNPGRADGVWGAKSKAALVKFQKDHKLTVDGMWGRNTRAAMERALEQQEMT